MPVLVVDDQTTMREIVRTFLRNMGFSNVAVAIDGSAALLMPQLEKYGLIVADWNMEPMSGIQLLEHIRADPNLRHIPFIMITSESSVGRVVSAKEAGADNYIVKPVCAATLRAKVDAVIGVP
jgi:two-component system chemotaxis response regulator CheY